jgi:HEAT repeat protein
MTSTLFRFQSHAEWFAWVGLGIAILILVAVIVQRIALAIREARLRRTERKYGPLLEHALDGDSDAVRALAAASLHQRRVLARTLLSDLVADRRPARIEATRAVVLTMSLGDLHQQLLRSRWWWQRLTGLQVAGLMQDWRYTATVVGALDDPIPAIRNTALDALADMQDPAGLSALVEHLHDASLPRGRRLAAIASFGLAAESLLIELGRLNSDLRVSCARALALCGGDRSRPVLCEWMQDARPDVRTAALEALAHVGLDERAAALATESLDSQDAVVRAMAASAFRGWTASGEAATRLAEHLSDTWMVAIRAARSLQSMGDAGRQALETATSRDGLAGALARDALSRQTSAVAAR